MVANKLIRPADVTQAKAAHFGAEVVNLSEVQIEDDVIATIPRHIARKYRVVPVFKHDNSLTVAIADPSDLDTIDSLTHLLQAEIESAGGFGAGHRSGAEQILRRRESRRRWTRMSRTSSQELTWSIVEHRCSGGGRRRGGGGGRAAHQAGQSDHRGGVQDARLGHSSGAAGEDVPRALPH